MREDRALLYGVWCLVLALLVLLWFVGCSTSEPPPPAVPAAPEDLSTWAVPELVQAAPPPTPAPSGPPPLPGNTEHIFDYAPGATFAVQVPTNAPLDLVLEKGEQVRNIVGGDRAPAEGAGAARWEVKEGADGIGETLRSHVFLTVAEPKLTTGLVITTTKRTYYLTCKSVKTSPVRVVSWRYPQESPVAPKKAEPGLLPDPSEPRQYHVGYKLEASHPAPHWQPRTVIDDGKKTFIIYPEIALFETVPMLRLMGPNGPQLVNARQFLNVVIVDQLVARAELRVGLGEHAETVRILREHLHTIACPGDPDCPVWPAAAPVLVRKANATLAPQVTPQGGQP
jgi:type IV secretion system protein VirB9